MRRLAAGVFTLCVLCVMAMAGEFWQETVGESYFFWDPDSLPENFKLFRCPASAGVTNDSGRVLAYLTTLPDTTGQGDALSFTLADSSWHFSGYTDGVYDFWYYDSTRVILVKDNARMVGSFVNYQTINPESTYAFKRINVDTLGVNDSTVMIVDVGPYTLPVVAGTAGYFMRTDGVGGATWAAEVGDISSVVAGDGLRTGATDGPATIDVAVDYNGGLQTVDDSLNIKLADGSLTCTAAGLSVSVPAGPTAWDDITDPDADATIAFGGYEQKITSSLDVLNHTMLTLDHTDADVANATTVLKIQAVDDGDGDLSLLSIFDDSGATPDEIFRVSCNGYVYFGGTAGVMAPDGNNFYWAAGDTMIFTTGISGNALNLVVSGSDLSLSTQPLAGNLLIGAGGNRVAITDTLDLGTWDTGEHMLIHDSGSIRFYCGHDTASVKVGPATALGVLDVTGTLNATGLTIGDSPVMRAEDYADSFAAQNWVDIAFTSFLLDSAMIVVGAADDTASMVAMSGDVTINHLGATTAIAGITRDIEWDTVAEINGATTDADFYYVGGTDVADADVVDALTLSTVSGTVNMGEATSLEIPNAANPTTAAEGVVAWDANDDALEVYSGDESESALIPMYQKLDVLIMAPDEVADEIPIFHVDALLYPFGIEVDQVSITLPADAAYALPFEEWAGDPPAAQNDIETVTTTGTDSYMEDGTPTDGALDADDYIFLHVPATAVDWVHVQVVYHITEGN